MSELILLALFWALYYFFHSFLASQKVRDWFGKVIFLRDRKYRLFYSIFAVVSLIPVLLFAIQIQSKPFFPVNDYTRYFSLMFATFGVILISRVMKIYGFSGFVGLSEETGDELITNGILSKVRHPIYSGIILVSIGFMLFTPTAVALVSCICLYGYLIIGIRLEERKLVEKFGKEYLDYMEEVPALIPKLKF